MLVQRFLFPSRQSIAIVNSDEAHDEVPKLVAGDENLSMLINGDVRSVLREFPSGSVQTCVTSPPYWSLRDYHAPGQIGMEASLAEYLDSLTSAFEEVRRVLRDDGTLWLNIGDSYTSGGRTWRAPDRKNKARAMVVRPQTPEGLKPKDLIGVPWRLAFALQDAGWYLRSDVIWNKPNCQPESVKDRPTRCHEYIFLFSKNERYKYDNQVVTGPNGRNLRTVWDINTKPYRGAHFATFPTELVKNCLLLTSSEEDLILDPFLGTGTTGVVAMETNRRFAGIELSSEYIDMAAKRLVKAVEPE